MEGSIDLPILAEAAYISFQKPIFTVPNLDLSHCMRINTWKSYFLLVCACRTVALPISGYYAIRSP